MHLRFTFAAALAFALLAGGCDGCDSNSRVDGSGLAGDAHALGDGSETGQDGHLADGALPGDGAPLGDGAQAGDGATPDTDPLIQPLPGFCEGSGTVVSIGEQDVCAGDLASDTFRFALCACEGITTTAQLTVDSFDSDEGPYGGANIGEDGQLGLNQSDLTLDHQLTVQGSAFIGGGGIVFGPGSTISQNLYSYGSAAMSGPGSHTTIGRNAFLNGDLGQRITVSGDLTAPVGASVDGTVTGSVIEAPIPQILPCPCRPDQILDVAALTAWAETNNDNALFGLDLDGGIVEAGATDLTADGGIVGLDPHLYEAGGPAVLRLPCGRFYLMSIAQPQALDIVVTARTVLFVDGDMSTTRFTITVEDEGELDLFVAGNVTIDAAASFGSAGKPAAVRTYIGGNMSLQANASFAGNVYAPNADIVFGAESTLYGSLMVRNASFTASGTIHFDSAIRQAGEECAPTTAPDGGSADDAALPGDAGAADLAGSDRSGADSGGPVEGCTDVCSHDCGQLYCLLDPDVAVGSCGPCRSDLDCCAPLLCHSGSGACYYPGG